ncbi:purine and uridine phosphorylase [Aspergillus pseudoustus]|uniref:Purine and uridine phosphorylase n=1 Tax=Aspergillus pseudoustus TaxID=1810923 RepID=A0ABR4IF18_9EURO
MYVAIFDLFSMCGKKFGSPDSQDTADSNTYTLGRIGKHNIVIACLPAGQYGETPATTVANNMVRTFTGSLRVGLMVGVGGGIPSVAHDIRLGDVVVSCPKDTSGGVLQYDMGKVGVAGEFHRTGSLNSPPRSLLTALSSMMADEITNDPVFPKYLSNVISRTERTRRNFARPNIHEDRLFRPEYEHPATAHSCDECLAEWEETRTERRTSDPQPHYGVIASGNTVITHGYRREQLRRETGALCVEMEAAGLMMDFPCLILRGICDYADSHKNKRWQGYAALSAASYAKELLGYVSTNHVSQERLVVDACGE